MKRKLFFLCSLFVLSGVCFQNTSKEIVSETTNAQKGYFEGKFNKPIMSQAEYCVNCGRLNEVNPIKPYLSICKYCGEPVLEKVSPKIKCLNCPNIERDNGDEFQVCSSCNRYMKYKVIQCVHCPAYITIFGDSRYEEPCSGCKKTFYNTERCIFCDGYTKVFREDSYHYSDRCELCYHNWNSSLLYTIVNVNLQYAIENEGLTIGSCPLSNLKVKLYNYLDNYVGCGLSDENGIARIKFEHSLSRGDNIIKKARVFAGNGDIDVYRLDGNLRYSDIEFKDKYINFGTVNELNHTFYDNEEVIIGPRALILASTAIMARNFAWDMMGQKPENIKIIFPYHSNTGGSWYNFGEKAIKIGKSQWYASIDTIFHEYGHHVAHLMDIVESPGGKHAFNEANNGKPIIHDGVDSGNCYDENSAKRLAWSEGFADAFAAVAKDYSLNERNYKLISDICSLNYGYFDGINLEKYGSSAKDAKTDDCEGMVAAVLWDLFDGYNPNDFHDDLIHLPYKSWFDKVTRNNVKTFQEFVDNFKEKETEVGNLENVILIEKICDWWKSHS